MADELNKGNRQIIKPKHYGPLAGWRGESNQGKSESQNPLHTGFDKKFWDKKRMAGFAEGKPSAKCTKSEDKVTQEDIHSPGISVMLPGETLGPMTRVQHGGELKPGTIRKAIDFINKSIKNVGVGGTGSFAKATPITTINNTIINITFLISFLLYIFYNYKTIPY